jgi:hypothetical protein
VRHARIHLCINQNTVKTNAWRILQNNRISDPKRERTVDQLREAVERMMVRGREKHPKVKVAAHPAQRSRSNVTVTLDSDQQDDILEDARRNPDKYQDQD